MKDIIDNYKKYRWFYTSGNLLVVGGKSSEQNDELMKKVTSSSNELIVMHTHSPGSPFSVIISDMNSIKKSDLEEAAVFTACFSQDWKLGLKKTLVDIFSSRSLFKSKVMRQGTWGVKEKLSSVEVPLKLVLAKQHGILRAIPERSLKSGKNLIYVSHGKIEKKELVPKINLELDEDISENEILSALPAGGIRISRK